jgi:hypothetical protein
VKLVVGRRDRPEPFDRVIRLLRADEEHSLADQVHELRSCRSDVEAIRKPPET